MYRHAIWSVLAAALLMGCGSGATSTNSAESDPDDRSEDAAARPIEVNEDGVRIVLEQDFLHIASENALYLSPDGLRVTNLPFYGSVGTGGTTYEEFYGPRVANATIGSGALTAGFNSQGRLTMLNWPSPGYHDHVNYLNLVRGWPNKGAPENGGAFGGVVVALADGSERASWLLPQFGWKPATAQRYADSQSQTVVTTLYHEGFDITATITDVVDPELDVLARRFRFTSGGAERVVRFAHYANMNPTTTRVPRIPSVADAFLDDVSDFLTRYHAERGAMVHARPYTLDPAAATRLLTSQPGSSIWLDAIPDSVGEGVAIAIAGDGVPESFQAGLDSIGVVGQLDIPLLAGSLLDDPWDDFLRDGQLSGNATAAVKTAGALAGIPPDAGGGYSVYFGGGANEEAALEQVEAARALGFAEIRRRSEADWRQWLARGRLPVSPDADTAALARRALMLIRSAQDRESGAIVANLTPQTPYREDWPRDGAFFNYALLLAGYDDMVLKHNRFYKDVYRIGGTWDSFYFADGAEGGAIFPYEVDTQAFALWALWLPFEFGAVDVSELSTFYPAIRDTANALMLCFDPFTGLQCYASEDDNPMPTQEAQGAASVHLALRVAAQAAELQGDAANAERWAARAATLRQAALERFCDAEGCSGGRGGVYLAWPSEILDPAREDSAPLVQPHLRQFADMLDALSAPPPDRLPKAGGFFQYPMESILALAPLLEDANKAQRLRRWLDWLVQDVAEPGVQHYGERIFRCAGEAPFCDGDGREYLHSVGFPHIWSGTEMFIALAFSYGLQDCPAGVNRLGEADCSRGR